MTTVFLACVAIGGTILVCQTIMTLIGLGGEAFGADVGGDLGHDLGGDLHGDAGGDFHGDSGGDFHGDTGGDVHGDAAHAGHADAAQEQHGSSRFFGILSFRTVVAAVTFFGVGGMAAQSAGLPPIQVLAVALIAGGGAMYGIYRVMRLLYSLRSNGTVRLERALGQPATVYLRIPAQNSGVGKIQINLQNRTMEYLAVTQGPELLAGATVVVVKLLSPTTVEVQAPEASERG